MTSDTGGTPDSSDVSNANQHLEPKRSDAGNRLYGILLLFVIVVGLPILGVPSLRNRLLNRVAALKEVIIGTSSPVEAEIAEESAPIPKEYERFISEFPSRGLPEPIDETYNAPVDEADSAIGAPPALITPESAKAEQASAVMASKDASEQSDSDDSGIKYTQGLSERESYILLLQTFPKVAEMVEGGDSSLRFQSWGSAKRSEDLYWVRLIFLTDENQEVEYIWQVEVATKRILPLSHSARSIS